MTEKRFQVHKVIGSFHEWSIEDIIDDKVVFGSIMHKYEADRLCAKLNELNDENKELKDKVKRLIDNIDELLELDVEENLLKENKELKEENEQLKQGMDKLFDYFAKWFEEERGVYIEDFIELWKSIQKGDVE